MAQGLTQITIQFSSDDSASVRAQALNRLAQQIGALASAVNSALAQAQSGGSGTKFADPTALVGLSPVDGSATTALRSDSAPALAQDIQPVWTSPHIFDTDNIKEALFPQISLENNYPATASVNQWSPLLQWTGQGWQGTKSAGASFVAGVRPGAPGTVTWVLSVQIGTAGYTDVFAVDQDGIITDATWEGETVETAYGGTGHTSYDAGDILIGNAEGGLDVVPLHGEQIQGNQIVGPPVMFWDDGEDGEPGLPGVKGDTGPQGEPGSGSGGGGIIFALGEDGEDGLQATPGPPGATGPTGATGATGPSGSPGIAGPALFFLAEDGNEGDMGPPGAQGPAGSGGGGGGGYPAQLGYGGI
jgi:hypothetical protein